MSFEIKYAPKELSDVVISDTQVKIVLDSYIHRGIKRPLLLYGGYGVGKTTIANLLPDAIEGKKAVVEKIKALEFKTAADVAKHFNKEWLCSHPLFSFNDGQKREYIICNELSITDNAAKALIDLIDDIQEQVQFIFTTNHIHAIYGALRSRCTELEIKPALAVDWLPRTQFIMKSENYNVKDQILLKLIEDQLAVSPDHRKLLQLLDDEVIGKLSNVGNSYLMRASKSTPSG